MMHGTPLALRRLQEASWTQREMADQRNLMDRGIAPVHTNALNDEEYRTLVNEWNARQHKGGVPSASC